MGQLEKATEYITLFFQEKVDSKFVYHNLEHTLSVLASANKICKKSSLTNEELLIVQMAALFHDTGFIDGPENHEERSANIAETYLIENGFEATFIDKVKACINATKMGFETSDQLCQILKDADMSGLASKKFFDITERLRVERNNIQTDQISTDEWDETNLEFLKNSTYKTEEGNKLYKKKKDKNLASLQKRHTERLIKKKKVKEAAQSISTNKSAQTQFKTALRNHIDLSNIADNKANIMISVNALILTVALPFLIDKSMDNYNFLFPTVVMSLVCLISMIYATLATRPIKMNGYTSIDKIKSNESNLFFFGNYHKMSYDEYKTGVDHVLSDQKALDDSIMRDLYFLGRSLGKKFEFLRLCYNVFMYGISGTVLALLVVYFL